jgi:predicted transcriptional regulator
MAKRELNSVTISVCSLDESKERLAAAFRGERQGNYIEFPTVDVLWKVLTSKRWEILQAMTGQDEMSIREIARRIRRDVKAVHGDVQAMLSAGLIDKTASGNVIFPYDEVHVDFKMRAA